MNIEELKILHEQTTGQDRELFHKQVIYFRSVMCSTKYTREQKEIAFENLAETYLRCKLNQDDITLFVMTSEEFERRSLYELFNFKKKDTPLGVNK
jgi:hypothetical protein